MQYSLYLVVLFFVIEQNGVSIVDCFSSLSWNSKSKITATAAAAATTTTTTTALFSTTTTRGPSKVSDPSGPTPPNEALELPPVKLEDLPEANYDVDAIPIPHQRWRRGETAGCEDPVDAPWRKEAERMIKLAVLSAGGSYIDTTWYLTSVCVTIGMDFQDMKTDLLRAGGQEIRIQTRSKPMYYDPDDPEPDDIEYEEDEHNPFYEHDYELERSIEKKKYTKPDIADGEKPEDLGLDPEDDIPLYIDKEFREDLALRADDLRAIRNGKMDEPVDMADMFWQDKIGPEHKKYYGQKVNTAALSVISHSIVEALQEVEEELNVLGRHEVVLASPSSPKCLDTQQLFDAAIGRRVVVRTHDPWDSNRSLHGVLVDRNTLDVYINQKGRLVTIPNNFVSGVELMEGKELEEMEDVLRDAEDEEVDEDIIEKEAHAELMKQRMSDFEAELKAVEDEYDKEMEAIKSEDANDDDDDDDDDEDEDAIDEEDDDDDIDI